ncbi:MAG: hypothetical protein IPJ94_29170 [Chloroflexi bacterium]|nr:hypothetical protein [Chloroflexota bacterium]
MKTPPRCGPRNAAPSRPYHDALVKIVLPTYPVLGYPSGVLIIVNRGS